MASFSRWGEVPKHQVMMTNSQSRCKCLQFQQQLHIDLQKPNLCFPCELWTYQWCHYPARRMAQVLMSRWVSWVCCHKQSLLDKKNMLGILSSGKSPKELSLRSLHVPVQCRLRTGSRCGVSDNCTQSAAHSDKSETFQLLISTFLTE